LIPRDAHPIVPESTCATVLVAELRGHVALSARLTPSQLVPVLSEFFVLFRCAVLLHGGQVLRLAEGGVIGAFGMCDCCRTHSNDALAVAAAIERRCADLRAAWRKVYSIPTGVSIGIHRGEVAIGLFGHPGEETEAPPAATESENGAEAMRAQVPAPQEGLPTMLYFPRFKLSARHACMDVWCVPLSKRPEMHRPWDYARRGDRMDFLETTVA